MEDGLPHAAVVFEVIGEEQSDLHQVAQSYGVLMAATPSPRLAERRAARRPRSKRCPAVVHTKNRASSWATRTGSLPGSAAPRWVAPAGSRPGSVTGSA